MYCAGAASLIINSIAARQINFGLIVHPPSENQFVVPPLGGIVWSHGIGQRPTIPPKGGTTNCAFHCFRASPISNSRHRRLISRTSEASALSFPLILPPFSKPSGRG